jgi:hypothetical protein
MCKTWKIVTMRGLTLYTMTFSTNAHGFTAFSKGKSFDVECKSVGVNGTNPNFQGSILPQELRPPVLNAIERTIGIPAVSTRKH